MNPFEKAQLLDKILLKFKDGQQYSWDVVLKGKEFKGDLGINEPNIKTLVDFLLAGDYLQLRERNSEIKKEFSVSYTFSDVILITGKGHTVASDISNIGFEFKEKEKQRIEQRENAVHHFTKYSFWIGIVTFIVAVFGLCKQCS
jgi:hypothetical protein